jgi:hypothetical protein
MDARLNEDEKSEVMACAYSVAVSAVPRTGNVLSDRKDLFRFLRAILGKEGVAIYDRDAQAFWSRRGLDEELSHDAELDIDAVYTLHMVYDSTAQGDRDERRSYWLHSHGLKELGFWDFDILDPSPDLGGRGHELTRALAFSVVEGRLQPGGEANVLVEGHSIRAVPVQDFLTASPRGAQAAWRGSLDEDHTHGHAVVCDAAPSSWWTRTFGGAATRPSQFLSNPMPDEPAIQFSHGATDLMAKRARATVGVFRSVTEELAEFGFPSIVKLGYRVDGGAELEREHLWFMVHGFDADSVDATLMNTPFRIARMRAQQRGRHSLEALSDWAIMTPVGRIDPRQTRALRFVRDNRDRLRELVAGRRQRR